MILIRGKLLICPTPLGNLEDITLRVLRVLREADLIAAEDTRRTRKLLGYYEIHTPVISYHQHSSPQQRDRLVEMVLAGKNLALVSDAGTPGISDPGQELVASCLAQGIEVDPLPGPCAAITAVSASGFPLASFTYHGFLPRKGLEKVVASLTRIEHPVVLYESPRRILRLLESLNSYMPERELLLARELTKVHQQMLRGKPAELLEQISAENLERGEFTIVLGPWQQPALQPDGERLLATVEDYIAQGLSTRDAVTRISIETGLPRKQVYNAVNKKKQDR